MHGTLVSVDVSILFVRYSQDESVETEASLMGEYIMSRISLYHLQCAQGILQIYVKGFQSVYGALCASNFTLRVLVFLKFIIRSSISAY